MNHSGLPFVPVLLIVAAAIAMGCGSPAMQPPPNLRLGGLQSISLNPPTADAGPDGQVQFVATGYYSTPPSPVTPLQVFMWGVCQQNVPTSAVTVTSNGLAQCTAAASGTYSVFAADPTECNVIGPCATGCFVAGRAQLTCP